jgi:S1-C subfamily serine protease
MSRNRRGLRSGSAAAVATKSTIAPPVVCSPVSFVSRPPSNTSHEAIRIIPPGSKLPGLKTPELALLREKQAKLASIASATLQSLLTGQHISNALEATLIFAQYEAGTAVCIDKEGWVLTCSHCFGDTEEEYEESDKRKWLLFYTGLAVQVESRVWDPKRDLALLKVIAIETNEGKPGEIPEFRFISLHEGALSYKMPILCIGQPGRDDLESTSERKTKYNLVEVSEGTFRGMVKGLDPQDNSEIGTLMHDAWTYWGHSGAPLLREADGTLIGLHSSWDDQTAMRHGIPQVAVKEFLKEKFPGPSSPGSLSP